MGIKTTILRLVIAVQFAMLAPKIVYTLQGSSAAPTAEEGMKVR